MSVTSISVIVITHNRLEYAVQAVRCAAAQSLVPHEIILVDDGSEPPLEEQRIVRETDLRGVSFKLVRLEDLGPSCARNAGAAIATGCFLALLDDDDLWETDYLHACQELIADNDCVITWLTCFDGIRRWRGKEIPQDLRGIDLFSNNPGVVGSNIFVRRSTFLAIEGFDGKLMGSEDKDFLIRLLAANYKIVVQPQGFVLYRVHAATQASGSGNFHHLQVTGKAAFLKKHAHAMSPVVRRRLRAESGYFCLMGGRSLSERMRGLCVVLLSDPGLIVRRLLNMIVSRCRTALT